MSADTSVSGPDPHQPGLFRRLTSGMARFGLAESRNLLLLLLVSGAIWGLAELTDEVLEGETASFDRSLLLALRNPVDHSDPIGPRWVEEMARDATALGGILVGVLASVGIAAYLLLRGLPRLAGFLLASVGGGLLFSSLYKALIDRPRPDLVAHYSEVYSASFPSGHSMMSATIYITLAALLMRAQPHAAVKLYILVVAVALCLLVGCSRVYLGVHWPTDVLAGWTAGIGWATLCYFIGSRLGFLPQRQSELQT